MSLLKNCLNDRTCHQNFLNSLKNSTIFVDTKHKSRNCNNHLLQRIIQLEKNAVTNSYYHRREMLEMNPVPESLGDEILEENDCKDLSVTGVDVTPE